MDFSLLQPLVTGRKEKITKSLLTSKITFKDLAPTSKARPKGNWNSLSYLRYETKFDGTEYLKRFTIPFSIDVTPSKTSPMLRPDLQIAKCQLLTKKKGRGYVTRRKKYKKKKKKIRFFFESSFKVHHPIFNRRDAVKNPTNAPSSPPDRKMSIVNKEEGPWLRYSKKKNNIKKKGRGSSSNRALKVYKRRF
ncbi:hypothetical protein CEXT_718921 [Caerostris extrusa]|uniref:Uncharacterized protein n=1 Tax=Caerostris extrusa TaxID=172846 RepID=A0AAV4PXZ4_CAEEX|nr:hypothetical protein CEXT_718921 [Caerostris extrusa]